MLKFDFNNTGGLAASGAVQIQHQNPAIEKMAAMPAKAYLIRNLGSPELRLPKQKEAHAVLAVT